MNIAYDVEFDLDSFLDLMNDKIAHRSAQDDVLGEAPKPSELPAEASVGAQQNPSDA